jgi:glycosyltransferase involved in cell wall biosynthesis
MADAVSAELIELSYPSASRLGRYLTLSLKTIRTIVQHRPRVVFVQSPSIVLVILAALVSKILRFGLVVDLHNAGVEALDNLPWPTRTLYRFAISAANLLIVSNPFLEKSVAPFNDSVVAVADPLPVIEPRTVDGGLCRQPYIVLVSSFAKDEPIEMFLQAFSELELDLRLYVTGRKSRAKGALRFESDRIVFTDFLSEESYEQLLAGAELVVDLTTREHCLVCGSYEALALDRPCLLSKSEANRWLFGESALMTNNTPDSFKQRLTDILEDRDQLESSPAAVKESYLNRWVVSLAALERSLEAFSE